MENFIFVQCSWNPLEIFAEKLHHSITVNQYLRHNFGNEKCKSFDVACLVYFSSPNVSTDTTIIVKN